MRLYKMSKKFSKTEIRRIKSLAKQGKSQFQIAKALHTRKQNVATFLKKAKIGKRATGAEKFWKDVAEHKIKAEATRKEAIQAVKMYPKWLKRRVKRLSEKERIFHERWANLEKEMRAAEFMEGRPEGMSDKLHEDYENYWETP